MKADSLVVVAGVISVIWCVFSCVFGLLVARSIRLADMRDKPVDRKPTAIDPAGFPSRSGFSRPDH